MDLQYLPGTTVIILNANCQPVGEGIIENYVVFENAYRVWWTYEQTGEREQITIPEWRLLRKRK